MRNGAKAAGAVLDAAKGFPFGVVVMRHGNFGRQVIENGGAFAGGGRAGGFRADRVGHHREPAGDRGRDVDRADLEFAQPADQSRPGLGGNRGADAHAQPGFEPELKAFIGIEEVLVAGADKHIGFQVPTPGLDSVAEIARGEGAAEDEQGLVGSFGSARGSLGIGGRDKAKPNHAKRSERPGASKHRQSLKNWSTSQCREGRFGSPLAVHICSSGDHFFRADARREREKGDRR